VTLSKLIISAIAHLHTVGLKGFLTLLGEKGFPPPNRFILIIASLRSAGQRVREAYSSPGEKRKREEWTDTHAGPVLPEQKRGWVAWPSSCSRNAHDRNVLVRRAHSRINQATL
jgi:hypothetical protein